MNWFKRLFGIKEVEVQLMERKETYNPISGTSKTNEIDGHEIAKQRLIKELKGSLGTKGTPGIGGIQSQVNTQTRVIGANDSNNDYLSLMAIASMVNSSDNSNTIEETTVGTGFHDGGFGGGDFSGSGSGGSWEDNSSSSNSSSYDSGSSYDSSSSSDSSSYDSGSSSSSDY
jgi:hypothetical protein